MKRRRRHERSTRRESEPGATSPRGEPIRYTAAKARIISAALDLFADRGVSGTSLQMIADAIGVTKAAVYHQFQSKEAIVLAVAEVGLRGLEAALDAAEAEGRSVRAREVLLEQVIDLAIARRHAVTTLQNDPVIIGLLGRHEPFQRLMDRLISVLLGSDTGAGPRVQAAMLTAAIGGTVVHPFVEDLDEHTLRYELLRLTRRLLRLPSSSAATSRADDRRARNRRSDHQRGVRQRSSSIK